MNILDIVRGTPYWAWALFIYLVVIGLTRLTTKTLPLWRVSTMPFIFIVWSLVSLYARCSVCSDLMSYWLIALVLGLIFAHHTISKTFYAIDRVHKLVTVPGSYIPLALSLIFFASKYSLGVTYALNPAMKESFLLALFDMSLSGFISGVSLGRFITMLRAYRRALQPQKPM